MNCVWTETRSWRWIQLRRHCETLKPPYTLLLVNRMICQHRQNWRICNIRLKRGSQTTVKRPDNLEMMHHLLPFWPLYMLWIPVGTVRLIKWSDYKCLNILMASPSPLLFLWPGHWDPLSISCPVCYICLLSFSFLLSFPLYSHLLSLQSSVWWQQEKRSRGEHIGQGHSLVFHSALSFCSSLPQIHFEQFLLLFKQFEAFLCLFLCDMRHEMLISCG